MSAPLVSLRRRRFACLAAVLATAASVTSYHWVSAKDDAPAPAAEQRTIVAGDDLTVDVQVDVITPLHRLEDERYAVDVTLTNTTGESLQGPLYLIVDETGVKSLRADAVATTLTTGEPAFQLLGDESLEKDATTAASRITFEAKNRLNLPQLKRFELTHRVVRAGTMRPVRGKPQPTETASRGKEPWRLTDQPWLSAVTGRPVGTDGREMEDEAPSDTSETPNEQASNETPAEKTRPRRPYEPGPDVTDEAVKKVMDIQNRHTRELLQTEGVCGTATGINERGELVVRVYAERHGVRKELPKVLEGIPVEMVVTGKIRPLQAPQDKIGSGGGRNAAPRPAPVVADPQQRFARPIPIGVSGINENVSGCSTGTIGARLIAEDGTYYALSNYHVFTLTNGASVGEKIVQPGPADRTPFCSIAPNDADVIGTLAGFVPLDFSLFGPNRVDAAVAKVTPDMMGRSTAAGAFGTPSSTTVQPFLGMKVRKMGRTTGFTTGIISGVNAAFDLAYDDGIAFFVGQIEVVHPITRRNALTNQEVTSLIDFSDGGDSGSLVVTISGNNPVGLLFAGDDGFLTYINPIDDVLDQISQQMGQTLRIDGNP